MESIRKPFQGVLNIIRFNWHFYIIATLSVLLLLFISGFLPADFQWIPYLLAGGILLSSLLSLLASMYVYDFSDLYSLNWIGQTHQEQLIVNINAGFDETSALLEKKFSPAKVVALDFYNPEKHTEVSIKRARKAYPAYPHTQQIQTDTLTLPDNSANKICVILSAHEIRDEAERVKFLQELRRVIKEEGEIYITEHLRDLPNFCVYNIGFLHFYSKKTWLSAFEEAGLSLKKEGKITPFISVFILTKHGNTD